MRFHLPRTDRLFHWPFHGGSVLLNAMAAIAVGMFVGSWVIGPAMSGDPVEHAELRSGKIERAALQAAAALPDPSPYRTPTPDFDAPGAPNYGAAARQNALAVLGGRSTRTEAMAEPFSYDDVPWPTAEASRTPSRYRHRRSDRHSSTSNY